MEVWQGVQICEGGSISASGFGPGVLRSQFTRQLSKPFDTVLPVGVDSGRKAMIRNNLQGGSQRRLSVTRVNLLLFTSKGRGGKRGGKRSDRGRRDTQQTQPIISTMDVKRNERLFGEISRELTPAATSIEIDSGHCIF